MRFTIYLPDNPNVTSQEKGFNRLTGQFYTKTEVTNLKNTYYHEIRKVMFVNKLTAPRYTGAVRLKATFTFASSVKKNWGLYKLSKPDCDNMVKALQDVLGDMDFFETGDQQVVDLQVIKLWGSKPSVEIEIEEVT